MNKSTATATGGVVGAIMVVLSYYCKARYGVEWPDYVVASLSVLMLSAGHAGMMAVEWYVNRGASTSPQAGDKPAA